MTSNRKRHKSRYAFALRVAIRFQRWVDTSIGPGAKIHPLVRAAYYKGVQSGLDAAYLSELEHARRIAYNESKDDLEDASMIRMVMSRAIAACRRDLATGSELNDWNGAEERLERLQYELSYYIRLGVSPESAPPLGSRKTRDQQVMGEVIEEDARPEPSTEPNPEPDTDDDWS